MMVSSRLQGLKGQLMDITLELIFVTDSKKKIPKYESNIFLNFLCNAAMKKGGGGCLGFPLNTSVILFFLL